MPKKKLEHQIGQTEQGEQTLLPADTENTTAENATDLPKELTADEFAARLFAGYESQGGQDNPTDDETPDDMKADWLGEEQQDKAGSADGTPAGLPEEGAKEDDADWPLDSTPDFSPYGAISGPLDIERRLDEELAALDAELAAAAEEEIDSGQIQIPDPEEVSEQESETGIPTPPATAKEKRGAAKKGAKSPDDGGSSSPDAHIPTARGAGKTAAKAAYSPTNFYQADFRHLDRELTEPERQEWNSIYASFRSQSILSGTVVGVDQNELPVKNKDGKVEMRVINSLVVIGYRVKILIPENAVWVNGEERGTFLMRGMIGATVDYVVINVDREGEVALASRALALVKRRRAFSSGRALVRPGDTVDCSVLVVGPKRCLVSCGGYDIPMRPIDMSYTSILDMREHYRPGQELKARVLSHNPAQRALEISVKEATSNPFIGAERRHPVGSRRQAVITSKYKGGVFCTMSDGTVSLCLYSNVHYDSEFLLGDNVIIYISQYDYKNQHIYGRIVSKW